MTIPPPTQPTAAPLQGPGASSRAAGGSGVLHHVELWVPDLARAEASWGWLLTALGAAPFQEWEHGRSWRWGEDGTYLVVEQSPALAGDRHERRAPGLNHLAFWVHDDLDALVAEAPAHGWSLLFPDRHPYAGGPGHQAAYLEDADGYEVELVSGSPEASGGTRKPPQPS